MEGRVLMKWLATHVIVRTDTKGKDARLTSNCVQILHVKTTPRVLTLVHIGPVLVPLFMPAHYARETKLFVMTTPASMVATAQA